MTAPAPRALGVDLGTVRVGLALSDPLGLTAQPIGKLPRKTLDRDLAALLDLVRRHDVATIVVGHPLLLSGERGARARDAEAFADTLRAACAATVTLWDERLTTVQAERSLRESSLSGRRRREVVDAAAATVLLQSWLDARSG